MFQDEMTPFLNDVLQLGLNYLGPSIYVGPAMSAKILTQNGHVLLISMYRPLTPDEIADKDRSEFREQLIARCYEMLGSWVLPRELEGIRQVNTPHYDLYEAETQNEQTFPHLAEELEPTPELGDHYIGAEILLPTGDEMARGHVVA